MRLTPAFIKSVFDAKLAFYDIGQRFKTLTDQLSGLLVEDTQSVSAYLGLRKRLLLRDGRVYNYVADSTLPVDNGMVLPVAGKNPVTTAGRWIGDAADGVNIKRWYEAQGNGNANDTVAINRAIAFVKRQIGLGYGVYRPTVIIPSGYYRTEGVNATELNGICLQGEGGSYVNATFIGIGNNAVVDVTGSSQFKIFNLGVISNANEVGCAKIGVLCALGEVLDGNGNASASGGLNGTIKGCHFDIADNPTANGGFGGIAIANVCSEEMAITDCLIRANLPILLTRPADLTAKTGKACVIESEYATIADGPSMTVVRIDDNVSLQVIERRSPGLVLVDAGSIFFNGYITQYKSDVGTEKTAIRCYGQAQTMSFEGVVEKFSQIIQLATINNAIKVHMSTANQIDKTQPLFDTTGTQRIKDCDWMLTFPNVDDHKNRYFIYHPPIDNNDSPANLAIINSTFACSDWSDNQAFITPNALKQSVNCQFLTSQPFERVNTGVRNLNGYIVPMGTVQAGQPVVTGTVTGFRKCIKGNLALENGGFYQAIVRGVIRAGTYGSPALSVVDFETKILVSQNFEGGQNMVDASLMSFNKSQTNPALLDIDESNILSTIDLSGNFGVVKMGIPVTGSASVGMPVTFQGEIIMVSDFKVEAAVIFNVS